MKDIMKLMSACLGMALLIVAGSHRAAGAAPGEKVAVDEIIDSIDRLYRAEQSYAQIEMEIVNPNWSRTLSMQVWAKGLEKTFIRIVHPPTDAGVSTLRKGNEMWNYLPKIDKVLKIPPSMMMGSWMGSDFTNDDLVKQSSRKQDYGARLIKPSGERDDLYYIEQIPHEKTATVWGRIVSVVGKSDLVPVYEEYYDEHGEKYREIRFSGVKILGGRKIPTVMELIPLKKKGNKTVIRYKSLDFSIGADEEIYSLRNLKRKN